MLRRARLRTDRIELRPITGGDYGFLYALELGPQNGFRWRFRGGTPSLDVFVRSLHEGVLASFVVWRRDPEQQRIGIVTAFAADHVAGHCELAVAVDPQYQSTGLGFEGLALFIEYCFQCWPLRKLYFKALEFNLDQFGSMQRLIEVEGRLREVVYFDGRLWDECIASLSRERWAEYRLLAIPGTQQPAEPRPRMGPEELYRHLEATLLLDTEMVGDSLLVDDLGLDSLEIYAACCIIEQLAGDRMEFELMAALRTPNDLYAWYAARVPE